MWVKRGAVHVRSVCTSKLADGSASHAHERTQELAQLSLTTATYTHTHTQTFSQTCEQHHLDPQLQSQTKISKNAIK